MKSPVFIILMTIIVLSSFGQKKSKIFLENAKFNVLSLDRQNTVSSDISPILIGNTLYWPSVRESFFDDEKRERKNMLFYDLYFSDVDKDGKPLNDRKLVDGFGEMYHEGPISWCEATGELFTTLSNVIDPNIKSRVIKTEEIKLRLVIQKKVDGKWEIVQEMPFNDKRYHFAHPAINKTGDTLVFASDVPIENKGEIDLFMSVKNDGKWSNPINLGNEINTPGNEMFPVFLPDNILSFSSDSRSGGLGMLDMYYTSFPLTGTIVNFGNSVNTDKDDFGLFVHPSKKTGYFASNRTGDDNLYMLNIKRETRLFKGRVVDDLTGLPINNSLVNLTDCEGKNILSTQSDMSGNFELSFDDVDCPNVIASKEGYNNDKKDITNLDFVELRLKQDMWYELTVLDKATKLPVPGATVNCLTSGNWETNSSGMVRLNPSEVSNCNLLINKIGYLENSHLVDPSKIKGPLTKETVYLVKENYVSPIAINNIYYDFDKWNILPESRVELNNLINVLNQTPGLKVEMGSHTDCRGTDAYNWVLSEKRSNSAVGYLLRNGVLKDRLIPGYYGETRLFNRCFDGVSCSEPEHRLNRRTEFKLLPVYAMELLNPTDEKNESAIAENENLVTSLQKDAKVINDKKDSYFTVQVQAVYKMNESVNIDNKGEKSVFNKKIGAYTKFYVGKYRTIEEATAELNRLGLKFKDAFIVAFNNEAIIPVEELVAILASK